MSPFTQKMSEGIENEMKSEFTKYQSDTKNAEVEEAQIQGLMGAMRKLEESVIIKVPSLSKKDINIDKRNLHSEMERSMVLQSKIIEDIFVLKEVKEKMKVALNSLIGILHHSLRFKNQFKLKSTKEVETYIAKEKSYNEINIRIKTIEHLIEKCSDNASLIRQKVGFIRDLTKLKTQEMFSEK